MNEHIKPPFINSKQLIMTGRTFSYDKTTSSSHKTVSKFRSWQWSDNVVQISAAHSAVYYIFLFIKSPPLMVHDDKFAPARHRRYMLWWNSCTSRGTVLGQQHNVKQIDKFLTMARQPTAHAESLLSLHSSCDSQNCTTLFKVHQACSVEEND